jgi:hypothetical protein
LPQQVKLEVPGGEWAVLGESDHFEYLGLKEHQGTEKGLTAQEVQRALECLETLWAIAQPTWNYSAPAKVRYFKFASREDRQRLAGVDGNGEAFVGSGIVHSVFLTDPHETAHVLTVPREVPYLAPFWTEGIAMYYTQPKFTTTPIYQAGIGAWHGKTVHYWAQKYLQDGTLPELSPLAAGSRAFRALPESVGYPVAGSFLNFFLGDDLQRMGQFKRFLSEALQTSEAERVLAAFRVEFGLELAQAEAQWRTFLQTWDESAVK